MAVLPIVTYPGSDILLRQARPVPCINRRMRRLIRDMLDTLYDAGGVGLAAPQVGAGQRVIVIDITPDPGAQGAIVLVNPEIRVAEGEQVGLEGCLSLPDLVGEVRRAERVVVEGLDRDGRLATVEAEGLLARALQHEVDHLDGVLFVARVEDPSRLWKTSELENAVRQGLVEI